MTPAQVHLSNLVALMLVLAIAGLIIRRRAQLWWCFTAFLAASLVGNLLPTLWPERFYRWDFWALKQVVYSGLYLAMALELCLKLFSTRLPRARLRALVIACGISVLTAGVVSVAGDGSPRNALIAVFPVLRAGAAWLMALLLVVAVYYHLPVHPYHKVILVGTALYHCAFVGLTGLVGSVGWHMRDTFNALDPVFYATTLGLWTLAAWRPEPAPALTPATAAVLQPWAAR